MKYHTPLTPEQRRDVDDLIKYTEAHRRPLRKPRTRKRDPHSAPRPVNCFLVYRREKQAQIAELCTGANHRMISKVVAKWWKKIDDATRDIYVEIAKQVKQEHLIKFPNYKYTPKRKQKESTTVIKKEKEEKMVQPAESIEQEDQPCLDDIPSSFYTLSQDFNNIMMSNNNNNLVAPMKYSGGNYYSSAVYSHYHHYGNNNNNNNDLLLCQPVVDEHLERYIGATWYPDPLLMTTQQEGFDNEMVPNELMLNTSDLQWMPSVWSSSSSFDLASCTPSLLETDSPFSVWSDQPLGLS